MDIYPPAKQRPALLEFMGAVDARSSALRRDECGDWAIFGKYGHIYAVPEGFQLVIGCSEWGRGWTTARGWESAKARLSFGQVTQDGDEEGGVILARLPSKQEATVVRDILGIPKARHLTEGRHAALLSSGAQSRFKGQLPASPGSLLPLCHPSSCEPP